MHQTVEREECDCLSQARLIHEVYRLWACTERGYTYNEIKAGIRPICDFTVSTERHPLGAGLTLLPDQIQQYGTDDTFQWSRTRLEGSSNSTGSLMAEAIVFPPPHLAERYFRNCFEPGTATYDPYSSGTFVRCDARQGRGNAGDPGSLPQNDPCIPACSFRELKQWVEARYLVEVDRAAPRKL